MRVLAITDQHSGCGYHRVILPTACLPLPKEDKLITNVIEEENFKGWDIVFYNRFIAEVPIDTLLEYKKKYGFKLVCDIDDYWYLDPHHVLFDEYHKFLTDITLANIRGADLITTTHERLYRQLKQLNPNVHIIPNALPYGELQFDDHKTESDKVRFIYAAGVTHERDLNILKNPLKRIASDSLKDRCEFHLCGYDDSNPESKAIWNKMLSVFSCGGKLNGKLERSLPVDKYMKFYQDSDVSIIPLLKTSFNSMKSNLKILEAATKKNPSIVSHVDPYKEMPVRYVNKQWQWYDNIKFYTIEENTRIEEGERLFEYCNENYNLRKWSEYRKQLFEHLVNS